MYDLMIFDSEPTLKWWKKEKNMQLQFSDILQWIWSCKQSKEQNKWLQLLYFCSFIL